MSYIFLVAQCRSPSTYSSLNPCKTVDVEDRNGGDASTSKMRALDQRAQDENEISNVDWKTLDKRDKNRMRMETKLRNTFLRIMDLTVLSGLPFALLLIYWVDQADADGQRGYTALLAWLIIGVIVWPIARMIFRSTPKRLRDQKRRILRETKAKVTDTTRSAAYKMRDTNRGRTTSRSTPDGRSGHQARGRSATQR
ncbi:hypothetical protein BD324DRAFT_7657 [Kockovaella imperatae]|uniref:Uncharacterized protein n=1 Tax=Kockovaella imperatae TaxID=4999 RepID=A0A1Y1UR64_9TREE|nr:hypothetical protein BD324DRAFT_7657 [Kockovaella imperatae]ORX40561.1 hypothetical protein BD324DRAFT_7657 [Kockovaella imperatae]